MGAFLVQESRSVSSTVHASTVTDVLVVGAGMWGSAAAKYLKEEQPSLSVCLVGPEEAAAPEAGAFSQHADEGRITRRCDPDPVWAKLAGRSMDRYSKIEDSSGVSFHRPVGFLAVGHAAGSFIQRVASVGKAAGMPLRGPLDSSVLREEFPFLRLGEENVGLVEDGRRLGAGLISPRALVKAQCELFSRAGGHIIRDVVESVSYDDSNRNKGGAVSTASEKTTIDLEEEPLLRVELRTAPGTPLYARRVLVAIGALTRWRPFLPLPPGEGHARIATKVVTQEVVRVAVDVEDKDMLGEMPCTVCKFGTATFGTATTFDSCYILPPIPYPKEVDEKLGIVEHHYLKIGHGTWFEREVSSYEAALNWLRGEGEAGARNGVTARDALQGMLDDVMPGLLARSPRIVSDRCLWDTTVTMRPFIDMLPGGRVGFCAGGNGFAAKSSDEIGRIAAMMMLGAIDGTPWSYDIPQETFAAVYEDGCPT